MKWLARVLFRLMGWRYVGERPRVPKFIAVGGPHTSNWDFVLFLAVASHYRLPARAIGKHTLVRGPFGWIMRHLGVIPVERDTGQGIVDQMVREFAAVDEMALVIAPEGTRSATPYWRSGFYRIALAAGVPLVLAKIVATDKTTVIGEPMYPTGDVHADMEAIREFFSDARGLRPGGESTIRLKEE